MPLKKIMFRSGVNRENTRYASESLGSVAAGTEAVGGWYESDKVRFRAGTPEKIGGWAPNSVSTFLGVCRSLWNWTTVGGQNLVGLGTNLKFYIERGGAYFDVTPVQLYTQAPVSLTNPFSTTINSAVVAVADTAHGLQTGDIATFSGSTDVGGIPAAIINTNHTVTVLDPDNYTFVALAVATATVVAGGGASVSATYKTAHVLLPTNPFTADGTRTITVYAPGHTAVTGDFVTFSGATAVSGVVISGEYQLTVVNLNYYTIQYASNVAAGTGGGSAVEAVYQINTGPQYEIPQVGWGAGTWGAGTWGVGASSATTMRLWSQANFGEDLIYAPYQRPMYYWSAAAGLTARGIAVADLPGASDVPLLQNFIFVSDTSRFVFAFGCNDYGSNAQDQMLVRWSDQESVTQWTPSATNQAGSIRLSHGSTLVSAVQTRQEIVVFTDSSVYSFQYQGPPAVWSSQLLGDNISIVSQNAAIIASGKVYWMGVDKFYMYDGRVQTLRCDLRQYIYEDINLSQKEQIFSGTSEGFNEVWWFYCSANSTTIDKYVVYNYLEDVWYYGTMARTAWLDSGLRNYPMATTYVDSTTIGTTTTYGGRLLNHEYGVDDNVDGTPVGMQTLIASSEFDLQDGHNFGFVYRILPDLTFRGSTDGTNPQVTMTLIPLANSGSGYSNPQSEGGSSYATIQRTVVAPVEEFTGQVFIRVRGRQMVFRVDCNRLGTQWQLGAPRIDIKNDGRRGNS